MTNTHNSPTQVPTPLILQTRKLVSVREISRIERIRRYPFAIAHIDGWQVVVGARGYKDGDLVVFFEIDSFVPKTDRFWELFADPSRENGIVTFRGRQGYRVRSTRVFGRLSQGLVFPLACFPEINRPYQDKITAVGYRAATEELLSRSFAETLGVMKWEFTERAESLPSLGRPPAFIRPAGWPRIQDVEKSVFASKKREKLWVITEKLDGVTMTVAEDLMDRDDNLYWQTAKASGVLQALPRIDGLPNIAVIGELCGSSIQGNTMNYPEATHEFAVFAMWDIDQARYLPPGKTLEICKRHDLKHTPVIGVMTIGEVAKDAGELLRKAEGRGCYGGIREGFVFHAFDGADHFKVISNAWLLQTGK
ncbi:hypothetical protein VTJ83DRAFT_2467 [Remersonia thermophila]|uniref:RNA ligase domain-containing protein n=1 Tax=Remersonia thermophila TaxID=72144 RepID=A0ABR4DIU8_9PEZI